jgi:hypothetical protein
MSSISSSKLFKLGLVALVLSNEAMAALNLNIAKDGGGGFQVKACDSAFAANTWLGFQIGDNGIIQSEKVKEGNCAIKTYSAGLGVENKKLIIHVMNTSRGVPTDSKQVLTATVLKATTSGGQVTPPGSGGSGSNSIVIRKEDINVQIIENQNGVPYKIRLKVCNKGFKVRDQVSVVNRSTMGSGSQVSKTTVVAADKCFDVDFIKGEIQDGDEIGIGLYSVDKPVSVLVYGIPWRRGQNTQPTNPPVVTPPPGGGNGGNPTVPVTPNLPSEPAQVVREKARQAAERMATNVARSLGQIENIRYNLFLGFKEEEQRANYYGDRITDHREYRYQFDQGMTAGEQSGFGAGRTEAARTGQNLANQDVGVAVDSIISGQTQNLVVQKRQDLERMPFAGLELNEAAPAGIVDRLKARDKQLQAELSRFYRVDDDIIVAEDLLNGRFEVYRLYGQQQYQFELLDSYFREEKAFLYFLKGYFQPRENLLNYYRRISDSAQYANAAQNAQTFKAEFENQYDRVINREWNEVVRRERSDIQRMGRDLFAQLTAEYAGARGNYDGKRRGFRESSQDGFRQFIQSEYDTRVDQTVRDVQSRAVLTDISVKVRNANGGDEVTMGDTLDIVLSNASNRGAVAGNLQIQPSGSAEVTVLRPAAAVVIPAFSKLNREIVLQGMMFVSKVSTPDQSIVVSFAVDGRFYQSQMRSTFEGLITVLGQQKNMQRQNAILQHVVGFLKAEWEAEKSRIANGFNNEKGNLLIERMAARVKTMNSTEQSVFKSKAGKEIRKMYEDQSGFGYGDDKKSALNILNQAGF